MTLHCYQHYAITRKTKYDYVSANFKNVLTIRWYFSYIGFSYTMLYCILVFRVLLKVIYLPRLNFKPVNFLWVCCLLIDASSSWFIGYCNQNLRKPLACALLLLCMDGRFLPANFWNVFKNRFFLRV